METEHHMRILITGIGGFIGSHFAEYFLKHTTHELIGLDSFCHKGQYSRLDDINYDEDNYTGLTRLKIHHHDLRAPLHTDVPLCKKLHINHIHGIINLASNSAVERSITDPTECWRNNCDLIVNMLELARCCPTLRFFIHISTDEVYGDAMARCSGHREWDSIVPSNPYSASKAAQEALCIAYWRTYDLPIIIVNTMNNIGERQDQEKFLPKIINSVYHNKEVPIYCDFKNNELIPGSRVYLDAQNHAHAINFIMSRPDDIARYSAGNSLPSRYNVCGETELDNFDFAQLIANSLDRPLKYKLVKAESFRPGYDKRYFLDGGKLKQLGFYPLYTFEETIKRLIEHAVNKPEWI